MYRTPNGIGTVLIVLQSRKRIRKKTRPSVFPGTFAVIYTLIWPSHENPSNTVEAYDTG